MWPIKYRTLTISPFQLQTHQQTALSSAASMCPYLHTCIYIYKRRAHIFTELFGICIDMHTYSVIYISAHKSKVTMRFYVTPQLEYFCVICPAHDRYVTATSDGENISFIFHILFVCFTEMV